MKGWLSRTIFPGSVVGIMLRRSAGRGFVCVREQPVIDTSSAARMEHNVMPFANMICLPFPLTVLSDILFLEVATLDKTNLARLPGHSIFRLRVSFRLEPVIHLLPVSSTALDVYVVSPLPNLLVTRGPPWVAVESPWMQLLLSLYFECQLSRS